MGKIFRYSAVIALIAGGGLQAQNLINQGVAAFRAGRYPQAVELFQQAVAANPDDVNAHLYLGTALQSEWIPGASTPENNGFAKAAEEEFKRALELDHINQTAMASLASLAYKSAASLPNDEKMWKLDEAREWYQKLLTVDPANKHAYYSLGVIAWSKWYPALMTARASVGMKPQDPGPISDVALREALQAKYGAMIDEGISNLDHALLIDPQFSDAMAYMNLLIRERADLKDTKAEYTADIAVADDWVGKTLAAKRNQPQSHEGPPPPPPPTPPAPLGSGGGASRTEITAQRIHVGGLIQAANLVTKVEAVYPPLALQANITGTVRFTAIIGKDGTILNLQLISGHPLLVQAAKSAVQQYVYRPTLLNGQPVEVITSIDVSFGRGGN